MCSVIPSADIIAYLMEREILAALDTLSEEKRQYLMAYARCLIHARTGGAERRGGKITEADFSVMLSGASPLETEMIYRQTRVLLGDSTKRKNGEG